MESLTQNQSVFVKEIVQAISNKDFKNLHRFLKKKESRKDVEREIKQYEEACGKEISEPPMSEYGQAYSIIESLDTPPPTVYITFELWFGDEKSDLCAEIELEISEKGEWKGFLHDVLVP